MQNLKTESPFFRSDIRLSRKLKQSSSQETFTGLTTKIKSQSPVRILFGANGLLSYACNEAEIWELMEAVSAIDLRVWKRVGKEYHLEEPQWFFDSAYAAKNPHMLRRFEAGMEFINDLQNAPKSLRDRLYVPDGSHPGIKFAELPPNLQQDVRQMIQARTEEERARGKSYMLAGANPQNMKISIGRNNNDSGIGDYFIRLNSSSPSVASGFRVTDYHTRPGNKPGGNFGKNGFSRSEDSPSNIKEDGTEKYIPKKTNCDQKLKTREAFFKQEFSLNTDRVTLHRALFLMSEQVDFNYTCWHGGQKAQVAPIRLRNVTLLEGLKALERTFPGARWTVRDSGFIVFRHPDNPVDYPERNPNIRSGSR